MAGRLSRRSLIIGVVAVTAVVTGSALYFGKIKPMIEAGRKEGLYTDRALRPSVAALTFETKEGVRSLSDFGGKVVMIDVWASWCAPCVASIPHLNNMADRFKERDFELIALSVDKNGWDVVDPFLEKRREISYKIAIPNPAPGFQLSTIIDLNPLGNVSALPTVFLVDREGRLAAKFVGAGRYREIEEVLANLLDEKE